MNLVEPSQEKKGATPSRNVLDRAEQRVLLLNWDDLSKQALKRSDTASTTASN